MSRKDVAALEKTIEGILREEARGQELAAAGRELVIQKYSQPQILEQYARLLANLHDSNGEPGAAV